MIIYNESIKLKPKQNLYVVPIGDIQGDEELDRFKEFIQWCVDLQKQGHMVRVFGTGDYFETFSPSERAALVSAKGGYGMHETTVKKMDADVQAQCDQFCEMVWPIRKNIAGLLRGHHYKDPFVPKGAKFAISTDQYMTEKLGCQYFGDVLNYRLLINGLPFEIFANHGFGGGYLTGGKVNRRLRMRETYLMANWYVSGHDNEKMVLVKEPMIRDETGVDVTYLKQYFSGVGCFQRAYTIGEPHGGYAERALYSPAVIGVVVGRISVAEKHGRKRLDYHVST